MGGLSGFWDYLTDSDKSIEETIKASVGGLGSYLVGEAKKKGEYNPKKEDKTRTFYEDYSQGAMQPVRNNPAVRNASFVPGNNEAATAASKMRAKTSQLGEISMQSPAYWQKLVQLAAGLRSAAEGIKTTSDLAAFSSSAISGLTSSGSGSKSSDGGGGTTYVNGDTMPGQSTGTYDTYDWLDKNWYQ